MGTAVGIDLGTTNSAVAHMDAIDRLAIGQAGFGSETHPFDEAHRLLKRVEDPRFIVTLADGVWTCQKDAIRSAKACREAGVESIAIGFGEADEKFLKAIASSDDASIFTSLGGLVETFTNIAQALTESQGGSVPPAATGTGRPSLLGLFSR
jgi:molecular chaperone DnaK